MPETLLVKIPAGIEEGMSLRAPGHGLRQRHRMLALVSQPDNEALDVIEHLTPDPTATVARIKAQLRAHDQGATPVQATQVGGSKEIENVFGIAYAEARESVTSTSLPAPCS